MCARFSFENLEGEGRRRGGPVTLDSTMWDLRKVDCRAKCRKLVEKTKPLLLIGSLIDSGGGD